MKLNKISNKKMNYSYDFRFRGIANKLDNDEKKESKVKKKEICEFKIFKE